MLPINSGKNLTCVSLVWVEWDDGSLLVSSQKSSCGYVRENIVDGIPGRGCVLERLVGCHKQLAVPNGIVLVVCLGKGDVVIRMMDASVRRRMTCYQPACIK